MYLTIERVLFLKRVAMFSTTPDDVLASVAALLEEVEVKAQQAIFRRGELGLALFLVVAGRFRVHDGDRSLNELGPGDVFGELSALDPEPRSASVSATEDGTLFKLDHQTLFEAIREHPDLAFGVIRYLVRRYCRPIRSPDKGD